MKPKKAIFLDRDGVINQDFGYVYKPSDFSFVTGFPTLASKLKSLDFLLIVVTNQSGVARGFFTEEDVHLFHQKIQTELSSAAGVQLDRFYVCPHHPDGVIAKYAVDCSCRKPKTGLIEQAMKVDSIDLSRSFLIGDKASDIDLARAVGIRAIQVSSGKYELHPNAFQLVEELDELSSFNWATNS